MMRSIRSGLMTAVALAVVHLSPGQGYADNRFAVLNEPGTVAIMRHALAPGGGDPDGFVIGDCTTQRNLDDRGRAQARAIGAAIRESGARIDRVLTSQWCRCRETAELLDLGPVTDLPALNSFFQDRSTRDAQTQSLKRFLEDLDPDETVMLVTHQVNISALTGRGVTSGEVVLLRLGPDREVEVRDRVTISP